MNRKVLKLLLKKGIGKCWNCYWRKEWGKCWNCFWRNAWGKCWNCKWRNERVNKMLKLLLKEWIGEILKLLLKERMGKCWNCYWRNETTIDLRLYWNLFSFVVNFTLFFPISVGTFFDVVSRIITESLRN